MRHFIILLNIGIVLSDITCKDVKTFFQENECCNKSNSGKIVGTCGSDTSPPSPPPSPPPIDNTLSFSDDSFTTPFLLGPHSVQMFEFGEKDVSWSMNILHDQGKLDKFGNNFSKLHFKQDIIIRAWVPTIGSKKDYYLFPFDEDNSTCTVCSGLTDTASGYGSLHDLLVSTKGEPKIGESEEFTTLVKEFLTISNSDKFSQRDKILKHPDYSKFKRLKTRTKINKSDKRKLYDGTIKTTFDYDDIIDGQLPVILFQPRNGAESTSNSINDIILFEQWASMGFVVLVFNGPNNHGPMRKLGDNVDSFDYVIQNPDYGYKAQFSKLGSVYLEDVLNGIAAESGNTKQYFPNDYISNFVTGISYEGIKVPKDADFSCAEIDFCGYVDVDAEYSHFSSRFYNAEFFEKQFEIVKRLSSKIDIDWDNVGYAGDGTVYAAATSVSKNSGKSTKYKIDDEFVELFSLKAAVIEDGRFTGTSYKELQKDLWWYLTELPSGVDHPLAAIQSTGSKDWNAPSLQMIIRNTSPTLKSFSSIVYPPTEPGLWGNPTKIPEFLDGYNYPPMDLINQWNPQIYTSRDMELHGVLKLIHYEVLWFKRYLSQCQICDNNKLPVTFKELSSLGVPVIFDPNTVKGSENKIMEYFLGSFMTYYDETENKILTV